jgi:Arc/MetJ family transcription regulator
MENAMGINVIIDDKLVAEIKSITGQSNDSAAIDQVLRRIVAGRRKHKDLVDLVGKVEFHEGYDPKALRS